MRRDEIVKALRCCNSETECRGCPFEEQEPLLGPCAEKVLSAAADMLEQDAKKASWISVKDRMPKDGTPVIALCRFASYQCGWCRMTEFTTHKSNMWHDGTARYWFPLPEPPKEEAK